MNILNFLSANMISFSNTDIMPSLLSKGISQGNPRQQNRF